MKTSGVFLLLGLGTTVAIGMPTALSAQVFTVVDKAEPDEFYNGIGQPYIPLGQQNGAVGKPKVNHDYAWTVTSGGGKVWWGAAAGNYCNAAGQVAGLTFMAPEAEETSYNVCEYGESQYPGIPDLLRSFVGDWRPPKVYSYDPATGMSVDRTPDDPLLDSTIGLRGSGSAGNVVFFSGPRLNSFLGINMFAFNATTGQYLGSTTMWDASNVRSWVAANGALYVGLKNSISFYNSGSILKWEGTSSRPFKFQLVGRVMGEVSEMGFHDGRLFATTWPVASSLDAANEQPGLWMSPVIPSGGLRAIHTFRWEKVWSTNNYDPDPEISKSIAGGPVKSFDGWLYWGTIIYPGAGVAAWANAYGIPSEEQIDEIFNNSTRGVALFRGRNFGTSTQQIEMLYGDNNVSVYEPVSQTWSSMPTIQGGPPRWGSAGLNDSSNFYIWSMAVHGNRLFVGTFDIVFAVAGDNYVANPATTSQLHYGADLWSIPVGASGTNLPTRINRDGLGNPTNHGARSMVSMPDGLYIGSANLCNLLTDLTDNLQEGGWELIRYTD